MVSFNKEQLEAINFLGKNVLVSASAGAGKTSVLVERLLKRCINDRVDLNKIVALTFTDAAAMEMKKRLSASLSKLYTDDNPLKDYIFQQLVYLQNADITTIDSFCLKIVKKYYYVIGLNPSLALNILDDSTITTLRNEAFEKALNTMLKEEFESTKELAAFFSPRSEDFTSLQDATIALVNKANSLSNSEEFYQNILYHYQPVTHINDLTPKIVDNFYEYLNTQIQILSDDLSILKEDVALLENCKDKHIASIEYYLEYCAELQKHIEAKDYNSFFNGFHILVTKKLDIPTKPSDSVKEIKDSINDRLKELCLKLYDEENFVKLHNLAIPTINTLVKLAKYTAQYIKEYKLIYEGMDFEDMEHYALAILKANDHMIAKELANFYQEIMVDEFQDTNEIQNDIIDLISNGHNAFRVGDVKQSIYRFRNAKPSLMRNLAQDENTHQIHLSYNYRSQENIVEFNNLLFGKCMNIKGFKDTYTKLDNVSIGADYQKDCDENGIIFYALTNKNKKMKPGYVKALFIARKIKELMIKQPDTTYKDYVVLLRSHDDKRYLKAAFEANDIPYNVDAKSSFSKSLACSIIISFLKLLISYDEIALLAVLTSGFYNTSYDQLATLKTNYNSLYTGLNETNHPIISDIKTLKNIYYTKGLSNVLDYMITINDFYENYLDNKEKTNFDQLYSLSLNYIKTKSSIEQFIIELSNSEDTQTKEVTSMASDENVVRAITIHQSKGLQYKTVFLWSSSQYRARESVSPLLLDEELGIAIQPFMEPYHVAHQSLEYDLIQNKLNFDELEEYTRLLYVATTRPQRQMFIVDTIRKIPSYTVSLGSLLKRRGISDTILSSIANNPYIKIIQLEVEYNLETINRHSNKHNQIEHYPISDSNKYNIIAPSSTHNTKAYKLSPINTFSRGLLIHEILEKLPYGTWTSEDLQAYNISKSDEEHLLKYNQSSFYQSLANYTVYREYPFIHKLDNTITNGTIDLLAINDREVIILDYKTDRMDSEKEFINAYKKQLEIYRNIINLNYPNHKITAYIYAFNIDQLIEVI